MQIDYVLHLLLVLMMWDFVLSFKRREDKTKCPEVKAVNNFDLQQLLGSWYVVEYYASEEEALSYSCMKAIFKEDDYISTTNGKTSWAPGVTMNFTYKYADDPIGETLYGNITWKVDLDTPAHWMHAEDIYDGIYNTYVLDTEYKTWALLLHCAEKRENTRYLSAFVLGRNDSLPINVKSYLKDKLPRYDIDVNYVFTIPHESCDQVSNPRPYDTPLIIDEETKNNYGLINNTDTYNIDK